MYKCLSHHQCTSCKSANKSDCNKKMNKCVTDHNTTQKVYRADGIPNQFLDLKKINQIKSSK